MGNLPDLARPDLTSLDQPPPVASCRGGEGRGRGGEERIVAEGENIGARLGRTCLVAVGLEQISHRRGGRGEIRSGRTKGRGRR